MNLRASLRQALLIVGGALAMLWAPVLNGYPFVHADSGTYIWSSVIFLVPADRPIGYGLVIRAMSLIPSLWTVVLLQALGTSFFLFRVAVCLLPPSRRRVWWAFGAVLITALLTTLSTYVGFILPDVYASWLLLGTLLFFLSPHKFERVLAALGIVAGVWTHNSHVALALGMAAVVAAVVLIYRSRHAAFVRTAGMWFGVVVLALGGMFGINLYLRAGAALTRGGETIWLNRLAEAGVLRETLETNCPTRAWTICTFLPQVRAHDGEWRWFLFGADSPIAQVGWNRAPDEQRQILISAMRCCGWDLAVSSAAETWRQFGLLDIQSYILPLSDEMNAVLAIHGNYPGELAAFQASRQQRQSFTPAHLMPLDDLWIELFCLVGAVALIAYHLVRGDRRVVYFLAAAVVFFALNAAVMATFGGARPRYQGRVLWIMFYAVLVSGAAAEARVKRFYADRGQPAAVS